jgi:hypothetical protein
MTMAMTTARRLLPLIAVVGAWPAEARAAGADEWQLLARAGYATVNAGGRRPGGGLMGLEGQYGLDDAFAARLSLESSWHPVSNEGAPRSEGLVRASSLTGGITYALDVMRLVPVFELGVGLLDVGGEGVPRRRDLGIALGIGADYLLSPTWSLGIGVRYQHFPIELGQLTPSLDGAPAVFSIAISAGYKLN